MDEQFWIRVGNWDCQSSNGGARGRRNLIEGVGDTVHYLAKIAPGETQDLFRVACCRCLASFSPLGATCGNWTCVGGPMTYGGVREGGAMFVYGVDNVEPRRRGTGGARQRVRSEERRVGKECLL